MIQKVALTPQVRFTANEAPIYAEEPAVQENKKDNSALLIGSLTALGAFGLGMLARKPKVIEKTVEKTAQAAEHAAGKKVPSGNRVPRGKQPKRKHRLEHTVPNRNPKPASLERQAETVNNIGVANANASSRQLVERAIEETPTKADVKAFGEEVRYVAPTQEEKNAISQLHYNNSQQHANAIGNNVTVQERADLAAARLNAQAQERVAGRMKNGMYSHNNGNSYVIENGKVVKILDRNTQRGKVVEITDEKKIAKHMSKHNIELTDLAAKKSKKASRKAA